MILPLRVRGSDAVNSTSRGAIAAPSRRRPCATAHSKGKHIVLVEDDRAMRDALKIYLQLDEHKVHTAASMAELDKLLDTLDVSPSIVISDFHLGTHERGSDAIEKIRRHFKSALPAILLTGDTSAVPARLASEAGIRMLNKPVDGQRLVAVVDELLHSHPQ